MLLSACGTTTSVRYDTQVPESTSFSFRDERPSVEKHSRQDRNLLGTTLFFGDDNLTPAGPELLKAALESRLHANLHGKTVSLDEFTVYVYDSAAPFGSDRLHGASSLPSGYAAAPLAGLISGIDKVRSDKIVRVRIKGSIDLTRFSTNTADTYRGRVTEQNIRTTLSKALDAAASEVERVATKKDVASGLVD
jgi:hypothetical protein